MKSARKSRCSYVPYRETGKFQEIVSDYLDQDPFLQPFYEAPPTPGNFAEFMSRKTAHPVNRQLLADALTDQYTRTNLLNEDVSKQIGSLTDNDTFTITTGQQTSILLGPLYASLKILSAIKTCRFLSERYPKNRFVPVFWMATEDHDVEEIRHVWVNGHKLSWETGQEGPVGRFSNAGMNEVINQLAEILGKSTDEQELIALFRQAYALNTLSDATRFIVHALFGSKGLLVLDADDKRLKTQFIPLIQQDVLKQQSFHAVESARKKLEQRYKSQVNGREINFFYLLNGYRNRLVKTTDGYATDDSKYSWIAAEITEEISANPERFSPNVIMRPVYQELILPDLAYIGGGAEVAYWLELKGVFDHYKIPFPALMLRNSAQLIDTINTYRFHNSGLTAKNLFDDPHQLEREIAVNESSVDLRVEKEAGMVRELVESLRVIAFNTDPTLERATKTLEKRLESQLERFSKKLIRAQKKKSAESLQRLHLLLDHLYPHGLLQERKESVATFIHRHGTEIIELLLEAIDPFNNQFLVFEADSTEG